MKTCSGCGAQLEEETRVCPYCNTECGGEPEAEKAEETKPSVIPPQRPPENTENPQADMYPMKWHNFQMVVMIIGGIFTIVNGLGQLVGTPYMSQGVTAEQVYRTFPGLKACDLFYGVALIALGVFQFIVRNRLKEFRANGPSSLKILYVLSIAFGLVYLLWASSATGVSLFDSSILGSVTASVVFMIVNSVYYSKRSSLFIH